MGLTQQSNVRIKPKGKRIKQGNIFDNCKECLSPMNCRDTMKYLEHITRRRICPKCEYRFSTIEITRAEYDDLVAVRNQAKDLRETFKSLAGIA